MQTTENINENPFKERIRQFLTEYQKVETLDAIDRRLLTGVMESNDRTLDLASAANNLFGSSIEYLIQGIEKCLDVVDNNKFQGYQTTMRKRDRIRNSVLNINLGSLSGLPICNPEGLNPRAHKSVIFPPILEPIQPEPKVMLANLEVLEENLAEDYEESSSSSSSRNSDKSQI